MLVHGSLDRAQSFRRAMRRLASLRVLAYDRRGYAGSRAARDGHPLDLNDHVDDLLRLIEHVRGDAGAPVTVVGHSYGGDIAVGAAVRAPELVTAVGAYEPPMPWLGFRRQAAAADGAAVPRPWPAISADPAEEAERFFRRMMGETAWDRLSAEAREARRADGVALVADLKSIRGAVPYDVTRLAVPAVFGRGNDGSQPHHYRTSGWLAANVPGAQLFEIDGAGHGAHLSHPDAFAGFVRATVEAGATAAAAAAAAGAATGATGLTADSTDRPAGPEPVSAGQGATP